MILGLMWFGSIVLRNYSKLSLAIWTLLRTLPMSCCAIYWKVDISWHFYFFQSWNPPFLVFYIADLTRFYIAKIHWNSLKLINKLPFTIFRAMTNPEAAKFLSVCQSKTTILLYLHFNLLLLLCFIIFVPMKSKKKKNYIMM